jgi:hypothetical protein
MVVLPTEPINPPAGPLLISDSNLHSSSLRKLYALKIISKLLKLSGKSFNTFVVIESESIQMIKHTDKYFSSQHNDELIYQLWFHIRCQDRQTKITRSIKLTGHDIMTSLPSSFPIDMTSKYKRHQFCQYILLGLKLIYNDDGNDYQLGYQVHNPYYHSDTDSIPNHSNYDTKQSPSSSLYPSHMNTITNSPNISRPSSSLYKGTMTEQCDEMKLYADEEMFIVKNSKNPRRLSLQRKLLNDQQILVDEIM